MSQFLASGGQSIGVSGDLLYFICPLRPPLFGTALEGQYEVGSPRCGVRASLFQAWGWDSLAVILGVALSFLICQMGSIGSANVSLPVTL